METFEQLQALGVGSIDSMRRILGLANRDLKSSDLSYWIDHTLLKPDTTEVMAEHLLAESIENQFCGVCINPIWVKKAAVALQNSSVRVCTVIGFPLGANCTSTKLLEAEVAIDDGAVELDMVLNIGALRTGTKHQVATEIAHMVKLCQPSTILKVILETGLLSSTEIVDACLICRDAGVHFVKTSTGFAKTGASFETVALMRKTVGDAMGVKASGGISDFQTTIKMIQAGATRIGTSQGTALI